MTRNNDLYKQAVIKYEKTDAYNNAEYEKILIDFCNY